MTSYRAAVLIFVVGASTVNFLAWKMTVDNRVVVQKPRFVPTTAPQPSGGLTAQEIDSINGPRGSTNDPEAVADYHGYILRKDTDTLVVLARQVAIITVGGVAWFLIRNKRSTA